MPRRHKRCRSLAEAMQKLGIVIPSRWRQKMLPESDRLIITNLTGRRVAKLVGLLANSGQSQISLYRSTLAIRIRVNRHQSVLVYVQPMPFTRGTKFQFIFNLFE
ncbi:MAG: hypothetical protein V1807_03000 [Patescibacteria group bacterium]